MKNLKKLMPYILEVILLFAAIFVFVEKDLYNSIRFCLIYIIIRLVFNLGKYIIKK